MKSTLVAGPSCGGERYICVHIYIYVVELKAGPIFAFSSVKNWSKFFFENLVLPAERRGFSNKNKQKQKTHF